MKILIHFEYSTKPIATIYNKPILFTLVNISKKSTPKNYKEISKGILNGVNYIVNLLNVKINSKPSIIIKLSNDGIVKVICE